MPSALFSINSDLTNQGFDATDGQALTFALRDSAGVSSWQLECFSAAGFDSGNSILDNPPRQSTGATELTLDNGAGDTGQLVAASAPSASITCTLPSGESSSWMLRSVVNGGLDAQGRPSASLIQERIVVIRDGNGTRAVIATETTQYHDDGWAEALETIRGAIP